jgi:hypothetical protein
LRDAASKLEEEYKLWFTSKGYIKDWLLLDALDTGDLFKTLSANFL